MQVSEVDVGFLFKKTCMLPYVLGCKNSIADCVFYSNS